MHSVQSCWPLAPEPQLSSQPDCQPPKGSLGASLPLRSWLWPQEASPWQQGRGEGGSTRVEREVKLAVREPSCWVGPSSLWLTGRKRQYKQWLRSQGFESLACFDHLLIGHTHSLGEENTTCHTGQHESWPWEQSEPEGAVEGRLCSNKRVKCPLIPMGGCHWLVRIILQASRVVKPIRLKTR